ncbi:uncharacterized protein EI90DRAFT_3245333 [Cantharellus anzutake]|uniref:uncharacterized protein n=1 Tax=Cantharellus anzutake TaxID=1750568 RepID=UPI0019078FE9|nr:uncharacterized protein EI90DRAFT_3245333 [Cantharellus anzutake]KAF8323469.1 hypothetical protein EI90DRAFT_3245333 [Cantharellus anzutake]
MTCGLGLSEFFGVVGTCACTTLAPSVIYALYFVCNKHSGGCPPPVTVLPIYAHNALTDPSWWRGLWDTQAFLVYLAWLAYNILAWWILPGDWVEGTQIRDGTKKRYKINGELHSPVIRTSVSLKL